MNEDKYLCGDKLVTVTLSVLLTALRVGVYAQPIAMSLLIKVNGGTLNL